MTDQSPLDQFAKRAGQLYSLPAVAVRILELTAEPTVDVRAIKGCIEYDPALTAKVLRVVNSSLFGLSGEVRDLSQALALLGIKPLKLLVLGFSLSAAICRNDEGSATKRYWRHTLVGAIAARELSERIWQLPGDDAFLAALLQDIGMLVLIQELGNPYTRFLDRALASGRDVAALEKSVLNFDHRELGASLLDGWALPGSLVGSINLRLRPGAVDLLSPAEQTLPRVLRLAELLADLLVDHRHAALQQLLAEPARRGSLSTAEVEELIAAVQEKIVPFADIFSCELPAGIDYRDVLLEAHRQMTSVAIEVAGDMLQTPERTAEADVPDDVQWQADVEELTAAAAEFEQNEDVPVEGRRERSPGAAQGSTAVAAASAAAKAAVAGRAAPTIVGGTLSVELRAEVAQALVSCRQAREALSLVLVEIDNFASLVSQFGPIQAERLAENLGRLCGNCDLAGASLLEARQGCFALILPGCDRREAVAAANDILHQFRDDAQQSIASERRISVSVGAATVPQPPKNFRVDDLIDSASRCLSTAQLCGGNALKSIGVY